MNNYTTSAELYKQDISKISKKLSSNEERDLIVKAQNGDMDARNKLIDSYLSIIMDMATSLVEDVNVDLSDLIQEGNLVLMKCIDNYSLSNSTGFYHYVYINVLRKMKNYLISNSNCYGIPLSKINLKIQIEKFKKDYEEKYGRIPIDEEIIEYFDLSEETFKSINQYPLNEVNMEDVQNNRIPFSDEVYDIEEEVAKKVSLESFIDWINHLIPSRNTQIVLMKYGVGYSRTYTSKEIGKIYNLSETQVNHVIKRKLNQFYHLLNSKEHIKILVK